MIEDNYEVTDHNTSAHEHIVRVEQRGASDGTDGSGLESGSGMPISPDPSSPPIMTPPTDNLVLLIIIELDLSRDDYGLISDDVVSMFQSVSQTFTTSTVIVEINEGASNRTVTVIQIHYVSSTGAPDNQASMELFGRLTGPPANVKAMFPLIADDVSEAPSANNDMANPKSIINQCM